MICRIAALAACLFPLYNSYAYGAGCMPAKARNVRIEEAAVFTVAEMEKGIRDEHVCRDQCITKIVDDIRRRIADANPRFNAIVPKDSLDEITSKQTNDAEQFLAKLRQKDLSREEQTKYVLTGIPIVIKDNIDLKGVSTTAATPGLNYIPKDTAAAAQRLIDAGAIVVAKTNMHELALGATSFNARSGPVKNALDPARIAGGSSGGTAVAVAVNRLPECGGRKSDVVQCPSSSCHRATRAAQVAVARSAGSRASCAAISR